MKLKSYLLSLLNYADGQGNDYQPLSDHFDGKKFYNPGKYKPNTFWDLLKWIVTRDKQPWPKIMPPTTPQSLAPLKPGELRVVYINHSTVLIQTDHTHILTDPIWSKRPSPFFWIGPKRAQLAGVDFANLPKIDIVLISHNHYDHLDIPTLQQLAKKFNPLIIIPLGNQRLLKKHGLMHFKAVDWWDELKLKDVVITFMPSKHWSARWLHDKYLSLWGSFGIDILGRKIYFAGDTGYSNYFKEIKSHWGKPDLALLPIGAYLPRWFMQENHLSPEEAVKAHLDLGAKKSIGIHFGIWQLGDDGFEQPLKALHQAQQKYNLHNNQFITLTPGSFLHLERS